MHGKWMAIIMVLALGASNVILAALYYRENSLRKQLQEELEAGQEKIELMQEAAVQYVRPQPAKPKEKERTLSQEIPQGKRAFTVNLDKASAASGMIKSKDCVDVLAAFADYALSVSLFQDVLVLASEEAAEDKQSITLALSPQQAQIMSVAMQHGQIQLALRPEADKEKEVPAVDLSALAPAVDLETLLKLYGPRPAPQPPAAEKQPAPGQTVEVIRGLEKEITPLPAKSK